MSETRSYPEAAYKAGDTIFRQGDHPKAMYILLEGKLCVMEDDVCIATIDKPGVFVGELSLLLGTVRSADLVADTDCRLQVIRDADRFFEEESSRAMELARTLAQRLHAMDQKFLEVRALLVKAGVKPPDEEEELSEELERFRGYLKAWRVSL